MLSFSCTFRMLRVVDCFGRGPSCDGEPMRVACFACSYSVSLRGLPGARRRRPLLYAVL